MHRIGPLNSNNLQRRGLMSIRCDSHKHRQFYHLSLTCRRRIKQALDGEPPSHPKVMLDSHRPSHQSQQQQNCGYKVIEFSIFIVKLEFPWFHDWSLIRLGGRLYRRSTPFIILVSILLFRITETKEFGNVKTFLLHDKELWMSRPKRVGIG